ncbi:gliding motility-associated C-terminal domain-containing protein [Bacteroidota bacterium]
MYKKVLVFLFLVLLLNSNFRAFATHIRAGEITAELIDCTANLYRFTITGYTDTGSTVKFGGGEINFGDGSPIENFNTSEYDFQQILDPENEIAVTIFIKEHAFPAPGVYTITFREFNRNANISNMDNSVNTPFYIETQIIIDPFFGCNNTPVLLNPPIDQGCIGNGFYHNAGAWDFDGDSLAYEIVIPKQDRDVSVANYKLPHIYDMENTSNVTNEDKTGPPTYTLDELTGDLIWDAPGMEGEYNIAFKIHEYRYLEDVDKWVHMGFVTRDMQIIIHDCENVRPELELPPDTCVVAGTILEADITATDVDFHRITISSFGGPYELISSPASYTPQPEDPVNPQYPPASVRFSWETNCSHVRSMAYQVTFKAKDFPPGNLVGPSLVDFKTWNVTVIGPPPEGLIAETRPRRKIQLNWDSYECEPNISKMQVWRRVDSYDFEPEHCETGLPSYAGYELIAEVDGDITSYLDSNSGARLDYGATYCYRLVAIFMLPGGGESIVSSETCATIEEDEDRFGPVITKASVTNTDENNGVIDLEWYSPYEVDQAVFPPPYTYKIYRADNIDGNQYAGPIGTITDTVYTDSGLNTLDRGYRYRIIAYDNGLNVVDTSAKASSVWLDIFPQIGSIELTWKANVPWSNNIQNYPYHYIYRDNMVSGNPDVLVLFDSVDVNLNGFIFMDDGSTVGEELDQDTEYCYYVTTRGSYGNDSIYEPLINHSQIICAQPYDSIPPCGTITIDTTITSEDQCIEMLENKSCNFNDFFHIIEWGFDEEGNNCEGNPDLRGFEIWFSENCIEEEYVLIDEVRDDTYVHENLNSFKGCYRIRAIDRSGNEGEFSNTIFFDNCPNYHLPNVFTPNKDDVNDLFHAFNYPYELCPRFVKSVNFRVYNRWGKEIYNDNSAFEDSIYINWDGRSNEGKPLPTGIYYYVAKVEFDMIDPDLEYQEFTGWVHILR